MNFDSEALVDKTTMYSPDNVNVNDESPTDTNRDALLLSFIENYRELPVLWDVSSKGYLNRDKKNIAYDQLLGIYKRIKLNATRDDVKKINSLRTNYRKESKKVKTSKGTGTGADEVYIPKCWTFKELSFLSETSSDHVAPSISLESQQVNDTEVVDSEEIEEPEVTVQWSMAPGRNAWQKSKKPTAKNQMTRQNELLSTACEYLKKNYSEVDVSKLEHNQRLWAEKFINDILLEGELGTWHRNSVTINYPYQYQNPSYTTTPSPVISSAASSSGAPVTENSRSNIRDFYSNYTDLSLIVFLNYVLEIN